MELRHLRYFVAVAHRRHFTQAAEELNLAQPALSQQIQQLERELGITLLERSSRHVRLTPAGEAFLSRAEHILADVAQAQQEMHEFAELKRGRVVIGALQSLDAFHFSALLARFHARYPDIEIILREEAGEKLLELLHSGILDLSLLQVTGNELATKFAAELIATEKLLTEEVVLIVSPGHALASLQQVPMEELRNESFISFKAGSVLRAILQQKAMAAGFVPRISFESGDLGTIRSLVAEGLGIALLTRSVAEAPGRKVIPLSFSPYPLWRIILLAWHTRISHTSAATACLDFMRNDIHEHPWAKE
ncbi:MAG TPA: LysR family transcriptional regulator [Ktedonobacteraceae bacterium]